ncbi:MAG: enoyl-CoA hydratase-related protein [Acidimicrobiales bacterium]|jgi:methylglutaconyl-CoA hydratase|nr:enoyl-CoA hydratase-related protein [Acidimicrobiales bacterium]
MGLVETTHGDGDRVGVVTVTLADQENRNALSAALVAELVEALDAADADPAVRVVVLTNRGRVFCAGADLSERSGGGDLGKGPSPKPVDPAALFSRFRLSPKVYVGRIAGHCVAGGMGLAAAMDLTVADESAKFGFTEVRRGVAPAMISVLCLPKMRPAEAAEAMLLGNRMTGADAARLGLVNRAVPADQVDAVVDSFVTDLLAGGPGALAATKELLTRVPTMSVDEAFVWTAGMSSDLFRTDEAREGMQAFLEKRPPNWAS